MDLDKAPEMSETDQKLVGLTKVMVGDVYKLYRDLWGKGDEYKPGCVYVNDDDNIVSEECATNSSDCFGVMDLSKYPKFFDPIMGDNGSLLVRNEYEVVEEVVKNSERYIGGIMITGQPGIGKSYCLVYLLVHRLLRKKPTFLQMLESAAYLFCERGIYKFNPNSHGIDPDVLRRDIKALRVDLEGENRAILLIDSSATLTMPPSVYEGLQCYTVQAASPRKDRAYWMKQVIAKKHFMHPWSWHEIVAGNSLQKVPVPDVEFLRKVFEVLGPCARECYTVRTDFRLSEYMVDVKESITKLTLEKTRDLFDSNSSNPEVSHKIILVRPKEWSRRSRVSDFRSKAIGTECVGIWMEKAQAKAEEYFELCQGGSQRVFAGSLFENLVHNAFLGKGKTRGSLQSKQAVKMEWKGKKFKTTETPADLDIPESLRLKMFSSGSGVIEAEEGVYYRPDYANFPTADSFYVDANGRLTLIQCTISSSHSINVRGLDKIQQRLCVSGAVVSKATKQKPWRIVFVVPPEAKEEFEAGEGLVLKWAKVLDAFVLPMEMHSEAIRRAVTTALKEEKAHGSEEDA
jgi:hypothetical protein